MWHTVQRATVDAVEAHEPAPPGNCGIPGDDHPPFAGGDGLGGIKTEDRGGGVECPDKRPVPGGGEGMGGVLDDLQTMFPAMAMIAPMSHANPAKWTGMIAFGAFPLTATSDR